MPLPAGLRSSAIKETTMSVTVIDSIMGSGKTTWMIQHINQQHLEDSANEFSSELPQEQRRYLYVTPSLDEVDRITEACPLLDFRNPEPVEGRKYYHLDKLIGEGRNICTTHSLFRRLTRATYAKLRLQGYTLVIDEVLNCVELFTALSKKDKEHLFKNQMVIVDESKRVRWNEDLFHDYAGRFDDIKELCRNGNLALFRDTMLIWEFPTDFLKCFDKVFILTYLFHGSAMASYLTADDIDYQMMAAQNEILVRWDEVDETPIKEKLRGLITIYEGSANKAGVPVSKENPLSSSWYDRATPQDLSQLQASTEYFFKSVAQTPSRFNCWTTFKKVKTSLTGKRYSRGFLPNNLRATNKHIEKRSLAYLCNIFHLPPIRGYFTDRGVTVYEDLFALSEMLQWLWRGQIRRYDPITVFIPSQRMRKLLIAWLESNTVEDLFKRMGNGVPLKLPVLG
jgi:hypothetical protein